MLKNKLFYKSIYRLRLNAMTLKIPISFFTETEKNKQKFIYKLKKTQMAKTILRKMNNCIVIMISDFKIYYRGIVTETAC